MVGMLIRNEIDVAIAAFINIQERVEAARFLSPFTTSM
jgi:hypothetical protein